MHITLICADHDIWALGLRSISAVLRQAGHTTTMVFAGANGTKIDKTTLYHLLNIAQGSDIIGISSMSRSSRRAKAIIRGLKPLKKIIVWGGMHPTLYPEDCVNDADLICRGEGEEFMVELAERISLGRDIRDILNGGFREGDRIILNILRPLIHDLDALPFPDFSFEKEFVINGSGELFPNSRMTEAESFLFSGSRGCIYSCHYCANSKLKSLYAAGTHFARKMSVGRFMEAVSNCANKFKRARYVYFTDEDFFARPIEDIERFAESYPRKIGLPFECMASPLQITREKAVLMAEAGMWRIDIGVESGSDRVKKYVFNRVATNKSVIQAAKIINGLRDIVVYYFIIIGNPYEEREDLLETIRLLKTLPPPFFLRTYSLVFIPGTELFNRACRDGILSGLEDSAYEMDFLGGLDERVAPWKLKEIYLNSLIALMAGKFTRFRMGIVPRALIPFLTASKVIKFCDRHIWISKSLAGFSRGILRVRRASLNIVSSIIKNRKIVYSLKFIFRKNKTGSRS